MNTKSNVGLYVFYKCILGVMGCIFLLGVWQYELYSEGFWFIISWSLFLNLLQLLLFRKIVRVKVSREGIELIGSEIVNWSNVKSLHRLHTLYILKTIGNRYYFFPIDQVPIPVFGRFISDSPMEQMISKMLR